MSNKNIIFIGFMGTGKTSVGEMLAKKLERKFIDTDLLIEKNNSMKIEEIFARFGERYFRALEEEIVKEISIQKDMVISTGGGVVINPANISNLKDNGFVILLDASPKTIYRNILIEGNRPLLKSEGAYDAIKDLLKKRYDYYHSAYDVKVDVDKLSVEEVTQKVIEILKEKNII